MVYDLPSIMRGMLWVAYVLYVVCFIPQVFTNVARQSTDGLSKATVFIYFYGYVIEILYVYFLDLPMALKVMVPMGALVATILVIQQFYYESFSNRRWHMVGQYIIALASIALLVGIGQTQPVFIGNLAGWIGSVMWLTYQIPQVYKIHTTRSVQGFNFLFIIIATTGAIIEVAAAIAIPLPPQGLFNGVRGFMFCMVFIYQFSQYHPLPWYKRFSQG